MVPREGRGAGLTLFDRRAAEMGADGLRHQSASVGAETLVWSRKCLLSLSDEILAVEVGPEWHLALEDSSLYPSPSSLADRRFEELICHMYTF